MTEEGWYLDPFGLHEDRWISEGTATDLVRDHGVESYDAPPKTAMQRPLTHVAETDAHDGEELLRVDHLVASPDYKRAANDAWDQTPATGF